MNNMTQETLVTLLSQYVSKYGRKNISDIIDEWDGSDEQKASLKNQINNFEFDGNKEEELYKLDNIYQVKTVSDSLNDSLKLNQEIVVSDSITEDGSFENKAVQSDTTVNNMTDLRKTGYKLGNKIGEYMSTEPMIIGKNDDKELLTIRGLKKIKEYGSKAIDALRNFDPSVLSKLSIASAFVPSASAMGAALPYLINKDNKDDKKMEALDAISDFNNAVNDTTVKTDSSIAVGEYPNAFIEAIDNENERGYDPNEFVEYVD